jgi:hypothetical protein
MYIVHIMNLEINISIMIYIYELKKHLCEFEFFTFILIFCLIKKMNSFFKTFYLNLKVNI